MIKITLTIIFIFGVSLCHGQYRHKLIVDTTRYNKYPFALIKIGEQPVIKAYSYVIDYGCLTATKTDSTGQYSQKGDIIELYNLRPNIKLLNTDQLLARYHIKSTYHDLPIYIDSNIIRHRETACFQLSAIVSVKVKTDENTHTKYINIHTIHLVKMIDKYCTVPHGTVAQMVQFCTISTLP